LNNEFKSVWNEAVLTQFDVKAQHLPAGTAENDDKPLQPADFRVSV
jgi:hypothetical protein